jgi:glycosyltransferase involved in cell wall biosynthesis
MSVDIAMLTSAHTAVDDRIFYREAKTLVEAGHSVCVVGRHPRFEKLEGVAIRPLPSTESRFRRLLLGSAIFRIAQQLHARLYIIHDPELIPVGIVLRALGKKVVYDAHENLPAQVLQKDWLPRPVRWALVPVVIAIEWLASHVLSGIIAAVPAIQKRFPANRTVLVRNFPTRAALATLGEGLPLTARGNVVIYAGGLSRVRGIQELVDAFRELHGAELWLVGNFDDDNFSRELLSCLPHNVVWLGWRPHLEVLKLYRMAKLGVVLLHPTRNHRCALPVKLFEYMGAGLPVVASDFPEYKALVEGCGVQVNPTNVEEIRNTIATLLADNEWLQQLSSAARRLVLTSFCWEQEAARLVQFCETRMSRPQDSRMPMVATRVPRHS